MTPYYLRIEGVNLANFISDTMDISTIRGGGLLLLRAIEEIRQQFQQLKAISTGASAGLFEFKAKNLEQAKALKQKVLDFVKKDKNLKHATFVIDILPVSNSFTEDKEKLLALNRWQQMQSPSLIFPAAENPQNVTEAVCGIDHIRPISNHKIQRGEQLINVSQSVHQRHQYGRKQKQAFYQQQTGLQDLPSFVNDLTELSYDKKRGNLHGKIAVIYLDGNGFGKIQSDICKDAEDGAALQLFDEEIGKKRGKFLAYLLEDTIGRKEWTYINQNDLENPEKHRLETLLWGGDEFTLVVPAWLGWWTMDYFFQKSENWEFPDPNIDNKIHQLTHAAGLVFCHHNAPIHNITALAKDLAELAKEKSREANYVAYQVMESYDQAPMALEDFRNKRCGNSGLSSKDLIIPGNEMNLVLSAIAPVKRALAKNRVYAIVQKLLQAPEAAKTLIENAEIQLNATCPNAFNQLRHCFGEGTEFWLHLIELWDYLDLWEVIKNDE